MHVVIMGCGRVGSSLGQELDARGHSVSIIDQDPVAFRKLSSTFGGHTIAGVGFDRDRLIEAGIERADAFAAVSSGDNSNIISARVARENFKVPKVIARIYDPRRAEIYQRLGIETVASVAWTTRQMVHSIMPEKVEDWHDDTDTVVMAPLLFSLDWIGERTSAMASQTGARIAFVTRLGSAVLPTADTVVQEGDKIHFLFQTDARDAVVSALANGPKHG
ncbi:MAG: potassium channel family protein [Candidatus Nanopelagicales bacterium]